MAIAITCASPPQADIGAAYSHLFPVTGDTPPDAFSITVGSLPAGLTIGAATGIVSGTPTGPAGTSTFTVSVTDSTTATATASCSITVNPQLTITTGNAPNAFLNVPYSHAWAPVGGLPPYAFQIQAGALPNGLSLNVNTGVISGTPLVQGLFNFTIRVIDSLSNTADVAFGFQVKATAFANDPAGGGGGSCGC